MQDKELKTGQKEMRKDTTRNPACSGSFLSKRGTHSRWMAGWMKRGMVEKVDQDEKKRRTLQSFSPDGKNTNNVFSEDEKELERVTDGRLESYSVGTED